MQERQKKKLRIVFDTNVLVSSVFWEGNESRLIELAEKGIFEAFTSPFILDEVVNVLSSVKFQLNEDQVESIAEYFLSIMHIVEPRLNIDIIHDDPSDNRIIECAVSCNANIIVSGDKHLISLKKFRSIKIISSHETLKITSHDLN